jgi:hypothetical protein
MSDLSRTVVLVDELPPDHPYAIPDDGPAQRGPLPEEAALLVLLEAARLAAHYVLDVHTGDAAMRCDCPVCKNAEWLILSIELGGSGIDGELQMGSLYHRLRNRADELANDPW